MPEVQPGNTETKLRLVIAFDADDTLWQTEIYYQQASERCLHLISDLPGAPAAQRGLAEVEVRNVNWYGYGIKSFTLSMIETAVESSGGTLSADVLRSILDLGREMLRRDVVLFEHARATLAQAHDLMLITKGDLMEQEDKILRSGLAGFFSRVEILADKTPLAYRKILDHYGIPVDKFVMVGNALKSDVLPVIELGATAVYIPCENTWAHERADARAGTYFEIEHLGLLPALIASWGT
jgi:putative hydrolase of the HAD superfamily